MTVFINMVNNSNSDNGKLNAQFKCCHSNQTTKEDLKPCPFCNGVAEMRNENGWKVYCRTCGIKTSDGYSKEIYAIRYWNNRV